MKYKDFLNNKIEFGGHMDDFGDRLVKIDEGVYTYQNGSANSNIISEASLSRLLDTFNKQGVFAIITAHRKNMSKREKIQKNRDLRHEFNKRKMGVYQLVGHWFECPDHYKNYADCPDEEKTEVIERSYFVPKGEDVDTNEFIQLMVNLIQPDKFNQDAFLLGIDGSIYAVDRSGGKSFIGNNLTLNKIGSDYSQYISKMNIPFVFEGMETPSTSSGGRIMKTIGILWIANP